MYFLCFAFLEFSWNSVDENEDIFEPKRSFSGVFNSFVNQWCIKINKNVFNLAFRLLLFPKFLKCWKFTHIKKNNFHHCRKTKISQIIFWSNGEIKMPQNVVTRLTAKLNCCEIQKLLRGMLMTLVIARVEFLVSLT